MAPRFETPVFADLVAEQEAVQSGKFQGRLLKEYSHYIFPGSIWLKPRSSAVTDFLRPLCVDENMSLEGVIKGLCLAKGEEPVRWVDMGGGRGLPMRQLATDAEIREHMDMTNVDLFDYGLNALQPDEMVYLEELAPGITSQDTAPNLILADVTSVTLPEPADLITSVEAVQYLDNPLAAISNWYNQLDDNGLMVISTKHDWASWVRYQRELGQGDYDETPTKHFLEALQAAGVSFAAMYESDWESGLRPDFDPTRIRTLAIQKRPGTKLVVNSPVDEVWTDPFDYKAVYYEEPAPGARPVVDVVTAAS